MKPWHWQPPAEAAQGKTRMALILGALCGLGILWIIASPLRRQPFPVPVDQRGITLYADETQSQTLDLQAATEKLIDAIIQIESHGNPDMVGKVGERGLMQIRRSTWQEVTRKHYGEVLSFDRAFEAELNREVGQLYLGDLQQFLYANRERWRSDLRSLLLASYNAGPERVRAAGFNLKRLPKSVQSYAQRGSALHDWYLSHEAEALHELLIQAAGEPVEK